MQVTAKIEFDANNVAEILSEGTGRAIMVGTSELRRYSNQYVRFLTGKTKQSSYMASDLKKGLVVYDTPYARYAYYNTTSQVTKDHNPNAMSKWGEYAIKHHLDDIVKTVQREMKK